MGNRYRVFAAMLLVGLVSCSAQTAREEAPRPSARTITAGEEFDLRLPSNPSTGYGWQVKRPMPDRVVKLVDTRYEAPPGSALGAPGTQIFTFVGSAPGRATLELIYVRPWEKGVAPARTASYAIEVL